MKSLKITYVAHFQDMTQKYSEQLELEVGTMNDLIDLLEQRYPGLASLVRLPDGAPDPRNFQTLNRAGIIAHIIKDFNTVLEDGDRISFL